VIPSPGVVSLHSVQNLAKMVDRGDDRLRAAEYDCLYAIGIVMIMLTFVMSSWAYCFAYPAAAPARGNFLRPPPNSAERTLWQSLKANGTQCRHSN
jgi:hypothetical protein